MLRRGKTEYQQNVLFYTDCLPVIVLGSFCWGFAYSNIGLITITEASSSPEHAVVFSRADLFSLLLLNTA